MVIYYMNVIPFCKLLSLGKKNVRKSGVDHERPQVSFDELCPVWAEKLKTGLSEEDRIMLAHDSKYCIVGEAWHYSGKYAGYYVAPLIPFVGCLTCVKFGRKIGKRSRTKNVQKNELEPLIADFMIHWTEKHG
jgi:hypothetical protein